MDLFDKAVRMICIKIIQICILFTVPLYKYVIIIIIIVVVVVHNHS